MCVSWLSGLQECEGSDLGSRALRRKTPQVQFQGFSKTPNILLCSSENLTMPSQPGRQRAREKVKKQAVDTRLPFLLSLETSSSLSFLAKWFYRFLSACLGGCPFKTLPNAVCFSEKPGGVRAWEGSRCSIRLPLAGLCQFLWLSLTLHPGEMVRVKAPKVCISWLAFF